MSAQLKSSPRRKNYVTVSQYIDVDVDLSDIDTDDLRDELESRGSRSNGSLAEETSLPAAWAAYNAMTDETPEPIRRFVAAACGRIW